MGYLNLILPTTQGLVTCPSDTVAALSNRYHNQSFKNYKKIKQDKSALLFIDRQPTPQGYKATEHFKEHSSQEGCKGDAVYKKRCLQNQGLVIQKTTLS